VKFEATKDQITLHGLGFLQVILPHNQRLHVWHPDLPRRSCFEHSAIHDHRFGFVSRVLIGYQVNQLYRINPTPELLTHVAYLHEGPRTRFGNRPWIEDYRCHLEPVGEPRIISPGEQYEMNPYMLHATKCEGICVTLMTKTTEETQGAHSYCSIGIEPDVDFDRKQWTQDRLWEVFKDSMMTDRG
jgi:hypothetical protein